MNSPRSVDSTAPTKVYLYSLFALFLSVYTTTYKYIDGDGTNIKNNFKKSPADVVISECVQIIAHEEVTPL